MIWTLDWRIKTPTKILTENYQQFFLCLLSILCVTFSNVLREKETHLPSLSLFIPGYIVCFGFMFALLKLYFVVNEQEPIQWDPVITNACLWRMVVLGMLMAVGLILRTVTRSLVVSTQSAFALDIWNAHIPFWTASLAGMLTQENLVYSLGTSLAMTCGLVLMIPVANFTAGFWAHVLGIAQAIVLSGNFSFIFLKIKESSS